MTRIGSTATVLSKINRYPSISAFQPVFFRALFLNLPAEDVLQNRRSAGSQVAPLS